MEWIRGHEIGHGSFAKINLAIPTKNPTSNFSPLMAVKSSEASSSASLKNEKQILDLLGNCPQIIQYFGENQTFENGKEFYNLFLEYASGGSLSDKIQSHGGRLSESEIQRYTKTILEGLKYIHGKGFVHCDIKPKNILVFDNGDAKIADFGLSKKAEEEKRENFEFGFEIRGSPLYMSPESVNCNEYESPCDIWAVGCAVVEMATGKPAWNCRPESNVYSLLLRIGNGEELPEVPGILSEEGKDFVRKCFVKDPRKRWTAEMLLNHPFVACSLKGEDEEVSISPRCPFDFEEWPSVSVQSREEQRFGLESESNSWSDLAVTERLLQLVDDGGFDWSVSDSWVTVR